MYIDQLNEGTVPFDTMVSGVITEVFRQGKANGWAAALPALPLIMPLG